MSKTKKQLLTQMDEIEKELKKISKSFSDIKKRCLSVKSTAFSSKDKKDIDDIRKKIGLL